MPTQKAEAREMMFRAIEEALHHADAEKKRLLAIHYSTFALRVGPHKMERLCKHSFCERIVKILDSILYEVHNGTPQGR